MPEHVTMRALLYSGADQSLRQQSRRRTCGAELLGQAETGAGKAAAPRQFGGIIDFLDTQRGISRARWPRATVSDWATRCCHQLADIAIKGSSANFASDDPGAEFVLGLVQRAEVDEDKTGF